MHLAVWIVHPSRWGFFPDGWFVTFCAVGMMQPSLEGEHWAGTPGSDAARFFLRPVKGSLGNCKEVVI